MMSPDSNDLSPRMSMEDIGDSLASLSFDRSPDGAGDTGTREGKTSAVVFDFAGNGQGNFNSALGRTSPTGTMGSPTGNTTTVLAIREEDLWLLSDTLGQALDGADRTLQGLEDDRELLPSAILRKCHEFADGLGSLAKELEGQSEEERRHLAEAIHDDLRLFEEYEKDVVSAHRKSIGLSSLPASMANGGGDDEPGNDRNSDVILQAISGASTLLRDVETAFRDIGNDEAEEIADAALIMARLFLISMQNIHSNLVGQLESANPEERKKRTKNSKKKYDSDRSTVWIEELSENEENSGMERRGNCLPNTPMRNCNQQRRMRVLWPPLGPKVDTAMTWTKEEASKRPILAVALGLTLWPVAISTALLGTSLSLVDGAVQNTYERFREGPWISVVEESAAQAYQVGRLTVATGKLVGKQSVRVVARQIERRGGLGPIAHDLGGMALDRITHPMETIGMVWEGFHWGVGVVRDATEEFLSMHRDSQESLM